VSQAASSIRSSQYEISVMPSEHTHPNTKAIKHRPPDNTSSELDETCETAYPRNLVHTMVSQLMSRVVLLQDAEAGCKAEAAKEDAEATESVQPSC